MKPILALHKLPLYNAGRLGDDEIIAAFSARTATFKRIIDDISAEKENSRAQHHLIIGQRGMGKTMLLARLAAELRSAHLSETLIPLVFAEEQYAVDRLSKFWLNCLDSLADAQEHLGRDECAAKIDATIEKLNGRLPGSIQDDRPLAQDALEALLAACASIGRRPVLLVDNLQLVFERLTQEQQHVLREALMRPGCPILVGASPSPPQESLDYGAAFYDHFKVHYLRPLAVQEMKSLMLHLAKVSGLTEVRDRILKFPERLSTLRQLTGGNPRTTATLFFLYAEDFSPSVFGDLENLLDRMTPIYKARIEELSTQQQVIASAIANYWNPVTSRQISELTGLRMSGISPQLERLEKLGFIERVELFGKAASGYQIAERFLNVWFLMRSASRRQRREVEFLTRFIENFYEVNERPRLAERILDEHDLSPDRQIFARALAATLDDRASATDLERHSELDALRQKTAATRRRLDEIIDFSSVPKATVAFNDLREKLTSLVSAKATTLPDEFADAVLSCRQILITSMRNKITSWNHPMNPKKLSALMASIREFREFDQKRFGEDATQWLGKRISTGQIRNPRDVDDWNRAFQLAKTNAQIAILVDTVPDFLLRELPFEIRDKINSHLQPKENTPAVVWASWAKHLVQRFGFIEHAEAACRKAVDLGPSSANSWNELGNVLVEKKGGWEEAEGAYKKAIELDPGFEMPWRNLGSLLSNKLGRLEEAENAFLKAIAIKESYAIAWGELGRSYMNSKSRPEDAERAYRRAIEIDPSFNLAWVNLGFLLETQLSRFEEAEAAYRKALEIDPSFSDTRRNLGELLSRKLNRHEEALEIYREAVKNDANSDFFWTRLGNLLAEKLSRYEEAADAYQQAAEVGPEKSVKWNRLGNIYCDHLRLYEQSEAAFTRALELQPDFECALQNLIFLKRDFLGDRPGALALFENSDKLHDPEHLDTNSLQNALFAAYDDNWGISKEFLAKALQQIEDGFPTSTIDDWMRASAVLLHLNYGNDFLNFLELRGDQIRLRPWFEAVKALHLGDRKHLLNIAPEIRMTADNFYHQINCRLKGLPISTRRCKILPSE